MPDTKKTAPSTPRASLGLPICIVAIGVLFAFVSSFEGTYVLDDLRTIVMNPQVQSFERLPELLSNSRRPVVDLSLVISAVGSGDWSAATPPRPTAFHAINLIIHLLAAITLFDLIRRLAQHINIDARFAAWGAASVALLWAVHPLQTESVTYIIQRAESLAGMFYLAALWCVVRCAESTARARIIFAVLAGVSSALAMGSKGIAVTIPITALLMDRAFLSGSFLAALRARWPVHLGIIASLLVLALTGVAQGVLGAKQTTGPTTVGFLYDGISPASYFLAQPAVIWHYLRLTFFPVGQCLDYAWLPPGSTGAAMPALIPMVILGLLTLWGLFRNTWWGFVGAWFFVILAPTSSFIPIKDLAFEHRMYLPLAAPISIALVVVIALARRFKPALAPQIAALIVAASGIALIVLTINRNAVYKSDLAMWTDITEKAPHNARAWSNLGQLYARSNPPALDRALTALQTAERIAPGQAEVHVNIANVYKKIGNRGFAEEHYLQAIKLDPATWASHYGLADLLEEMDRIEEAIFHYEQTETILTSRSRVPTKNESLAIAAAANQRGLLLVQSGRAIDAASAFQVAVENQPNNPTHHATLGLVLAQLGRLDEAEIAARDALRLDPNSVPAQRVLAIVRQLRSNG